MDEAALRQRAEQADAGLGARGGVQRVRLPRRARVGISVGEPGRFDGQQSDLMCPYVVGVARQLPERVVTHDQLGLEVANVGDEVADCFVEGGVDEPGPAGGRLGVAGIVVAEQAGDSGAQDCQGFGDFRCPAAVRRPGGDYDGGAAPAA
ncbi:hypothetical protein GCM10014713_59480 [Streptomyces purpureus]|uniref:Uncharacterized protein n=1 Tax=Streptomyces purpureus TaxID=1951 RepID=A0A918HEX5_9ACTN|nr:hypothetical protein GCM10014713_59480 [Streptomyces purpureus]